MTANEKTLATFETRLRQMILRFQEALSDARIQREDDEAVAGAVGSEAVGL